MDGVLPRDTRYSAWSTCTHTEYPSTTPGWWTLTFSQAVDVTRFLIYNRRNKKIKRNTLANVNLYIKKGSWQYNKLQKIHKEFNQHIFTEQLSIEEHTRFRLFKMNLSVSTLQADSAKD